MQKLNKYQIESLASGMKGKSINKIYSIHEKENKIKLELLEAQRKELLYKTRAEVLKEKLKKIQNKL